MSIQFDEDVPAIPAIHNLTVAEVFAESLNVPIIEGNVVEGAAIQQKRRGKAIEWKYVKKFASIAEARESFTRGNLTEKEQFLGRKYHGKTSAIYINCQKVICGCRKKWRLVSCETVFDVILEETSEDHSNHDLFVRSGGNGLSHQQITITQEALQENFRMKPLQIVNYFRDKAAHDLTVDPACVIIPTPDIVRLSSYLSYQRRKQSGALAAVTEKRAAARLLNENTSPADANTPNESAAKKIKTTHKKVQNNEIEKVRCGNTSCMCAKVCSTNSTAEEYENWEKKWTKCIIGNCKLQFCPDCSYQGELHSLVCKI